MRSGGGGMGPVISAGLEGTLGQKCMTQQKKKAEALRQLSCSWLISGLGCERPSRRKKNNPHCVPRHTGAGLRNIWNCSVKHICGEHFCSPDRKRKEEEHSQKKEEEEEGTGSSPGLWHLNEDVQTQHAPL